MVLLLAALCLLGCGNEAEKAGQISGMQTVTDSIGRQVEIPQPVKRAAVANAYNAELINAVGALDCIIGVDFNIYNDQTGFRGVFKRDQIIGKGQRELNYEKIIDLAPEVLILTGNGSVQEAEEKLTPFGIKVIVVDAYYTDAFTKNARLMGTIFGKENEAEKLISYFDGQLAYIRRQLEGVKKKRVYFEYRREGNTTVPGDYFYHMVEYAGGDNIFKDAVNVSVDSESIIDRNPEYIVKVSAVNTPSTYEPPSPEEHRAILDELVNRPGWNTIDAVQNHHILLLSHYVHGGASKLVGTMYIAKFLYPERLPDLHPEEVFRTWLTEYQHVPYISGHTYPDFSGQ